MGVITGNAALPGHVTVFATSTACPRKSFWRSANRGFMPKGTIPLTLVHSPHRRFWWWKRVRLMPPSSGVTNPTSPRMLLLLLSERLLVVLTSDLALSLLLLPGAIMLPPHLLPLLPKQPALPRHNCAPSAAPAGATLSCLKIRCCQTPTRCLRGAPRCRRVGESDNVYTVPQMSRTFLSRALT